MNEQTTHVFYWHKMETFLETPIHYGFAIDTEGELFPVNDYLGQKLVLSARAEKRCVACARVIKKTFHEGYCFPCFQQLPQCDLCIMKPDLCHFHLGTCRDSAWGEAYCMQPHFVYLALSSDLKVGLSREKNIYHRWMDQGAVAGIKCLQLQTRFQAGVAEKILMQFFADKTHWQKMLKNEVAEVDLLQAQQRLQQLWLEHKAPFETQFSASAWSFVQEAPVSLHYPVIEYPKKVVSLNFDKTPVIEGTLLGVKGQYLILDTGVLNARKYSGYQIEWNAKK